MIRAGLLALAILIVGGAAGAQGATLKLRDLGPVGRSVRGDGVRYIAYAPDADRVTLLDTQTGAVSYVPTPGDCGFEDIHHGTLLWSCSRGVTRSFSGGLTYDVATGTIAMLPVPTPAPGDYPEQISYTAIGDQWAQATISGYHYSYVAYVNRTTGAESFLSSHRASRARVADGDNAALKRTLCDGMRRPDVIPEAFGIGVIPGDLAIAGNWAAATNYVADSAPGRVQLQHCGHMTRTLKVCTGSFCAQPVINGQIVAWTQSNYDKTGAPRPSRLVVRSLRSGRTRFGVIPTNGTPLLVGGRLFALSGGRLYRAAL